MRGPLWQYRGTLAWPAMMHAMRHAPRTFETENPLGTYLLRGNGPRVGLVAATQDWARRINRMRDSDPEDHA